MSQFDPQERNVSKARLTLRRWFPERQIIVRSGERVRSLKLSSASQVAVFAAGLAVGGWMAFSSAMFVGHEQIISAKNEEVDRVRSAYKGLLAQVSVYKERIAGITDSLERNHAHILSLVDQNLTLDTRLESMERELASTAQERDAIERKSADLAGQIKKLKSEIVTAASVGGDGEGAPPVALAAMDASDLVEEMGAVEIRRARASRERDALREELERLEADLGQAERGGDIIETDLDSIEVELRRVVLQRDLATAQREAMRKRVDALEKTIAGMERSQIELFTRFTDLAGDKIAEVETALSSTGIDLDALITKTQKRFGTGGPFVPSVPDGEEADPLKQSMNDAHLKLDRLDVLRRLTSTMPLAEPMKPGYRISSTFGRRSDPINGRAAMHEGLDMVSHYKSPIVAPGPGKVVYAGWRGRYGRLVEIDHGNGLRTRYGHMAKVLVKKGQMVETGTEIGLLGNSGRSTGAHLHYEVLVNGEPHDPMLFIKAGSDVFKG
ncbi:peptidoglycan DD-metalloendopeptidase family protein [Caenispirillum salinarum]|uniref:peptidoglycan DD-metalloendopeptidase family protein n=1 Tax=Caenispirillum salinarum TaxID=859058 RepID=UPI00384CB20F